MVPVKPAMPSTVTGVGRDDTADLVVGDQRLRLDRHRDPDRVAAVAGQDQLAGRELAEAPRRSRRSG